MAKGLRHQLSLHDAGGILENPFIAEDIEGTESKGHNIKNTNNNIKNITENRLEANDELKDFDNIANDHRNSSQMVQIVKLLKSYFYFHLH